MVAGGGASAVAEHENLTVLPERLLQRREHARDFLHRNGIQRRLLRGDVVGDPVVHADSLMRRSGLDRPIFASAGQLDDSGSPKLCVLGSAGVSPAAFGLQPKAFVIVVFMLELRVRAPNRTIRRHAEWGDRDGRGPQPERAISAPEKTAL